VYGWVLPVLYRTVLRNLKPITILRAEFGTSA
jgi:hypothetical protein